MCKGICRLPPGCSRVVKVAEQLFGHRDGGGLVGDDDIDDTVGRLLEIGPTSSGATSRGSPAIIAGPPMPSEVSSVATIRSEQPAITGSYRRNTGPFTTAIRGTTPDSDAH